ncbi:MAG: MgtC/SapB family protein [Nanoarchaeota archaeon]|nr:MgtC/SapB family protein [Nanoarchaeota archaeon]MBU4086267.1 MgtC/SapB family protein [Nanoarchaeota archaeon]
MELEVFINFLLAIGIGAILGIEREIVHQKKKITDFAGIRTFILIAILGFLLAYITINLFNSFSAFIVGFAAFMILVIASYVILAMKTGRVGATTEITAIITFLLAAIVTLDITKNLRLIAIIIAVIVASLLALKENLHKFARSVQTTEVYAAIKMAIISIVILPFLPNKAYTMLDIPVLREIIAIFPKTIPLIQQINVFNPFRIWMMVVFISGLSFIGYILVRLIGTNRGIGLTSMLGGLVSSTAVTISLSEKSKESKANSPLAFGIILASSIMFIRVLIEVSVVNNSLLKFLAIPLGAMALAGLVIAFIISRNSKSEKTKKVEFKNPFALWPALKFGLFFVFILVVSKLLFILFGNSGILIAALVSGLADVDAITITISTLALGSLDAKIAIIGIILAVAANTVVKGAITRIMGDNGLAKKVTIAFLIILIIGLALAFLV